MSSSSSSSSSPLFFGPQTKLPTTEQSRVVRHVLLNLPRLRGFLTAIEQLPSVWELLVASDPALGSVAALDSIQVILQWLKTDNAPNFASEKNSLCTPLTLIVQVAQYFQHLETSSTSHAQTLHLASKAGVHGFCTGILAAMSVASSQNEEELIGHASAALRLALCIGAYVDLSCQTSSSKSLCTVVRSKSAEDMQNLPELLQQWKNAYVSVIYDKDTVTITATETDMPEINASLNQKGYVIREVAIEGRFHSSENASALQMVYKHCEKLDCLRLPDASTLHVPVRSNVDGSLIAQGSLSAIAAPILLTEVSDWYKTMSSAMQDIAPESAVTVFGLCDVIPASIQRVQQLRVNRTWTQLPAGTTDAPKPLWEPEYPEDAVAIIGMSAKYAGVDSLEEFWQVVEAGRSMCTELPDGRWPREDLRRTKKGSKFYGNFVRDLDSFDHKFFKKSSKEAASMDPQQRLLLEGSYLALESAGYFTQDEIEENVGCFIGVATGDYHDNIASNPVSAFSALGELRAFLCGRISYHYGWTGPSMTFDTACSASMVAIDSACRSIQTGQCSLALAGGVATNSSPNLWENLRGASFLSPTGPTKPFDEKADGYCRGEGVGLIVLKKLSQAVKDRDFVLGVIPSTGVNQAKNETYITVPHGPSQTKLYEKVIARSGLHPDQFTFVETHGTGTQKGDPAEMDSLRGIFGKESRSSTLYLGSVKGNIGHCEAASGVASVIKTVMQMHQGVIPPIANHQSLNPKIPALEPSGMAIPKSVLPWNADFKAALVNNYGAAGSNGAMVLCGPLASSTVNATASASKVPIILSANTEDSLNGYCNALSSWLSRQANASQPAFFSSLGYNLSRKVNRLFKHTLVTTASTAAELIEKLGDVKPNVSNDKKPIVLVFGGQTSSCVNLSRHVYDNAAILREHLNVCDQAIQAAGFKSIFPAIFQEEPASDLVNLHCMFLASQYACAKAWMDCGVTPAAVMGHSFGQLTAMCISGILSLEDTVKLVAGRATLMQKYWGAESGSMVALESDVSTAESIAADIDTAEIACYNGSMSHVLVGSAVAMDKVEKQCSSLKTRYRRLRVTNGFHSVFTEPLIPHLENLAEELTFREATIPIETCSKGSSWDAFTPAIVAGHTRAPVYFGDAVRRLEARLGKCAWVEAGSASSVTSMVRRAVEANAEHTFIPLQLNGKDAMGSLAEITATLMKAVPQATFWPFHKLQHAEYSLLHLPPYQFEKHRHWLTWKDYAESPVAVEEPKAPLQHRSNELLQCLEVNQSRSRFSVNCMNEEFQTFVKGHAVLDQPLCPADMYVELVHRAVRTLEAEAKSRLPAIEKLSIVAPLGIDPTQDIYLDLDRQADVLEWKFVFSSQSSNGKIQKHASGVAILNKVEDLSIRVEFDRYGKLLGKGRAAWVLADRHAEGMQGALVYTLFSKVVNYAPYYQGVQMIAANGTEVAARIAMPASTVKTENMVMDPVLIDNFVQVAGIKVNCLNYCPPNQVYICGHIERIQANKIFMEKANSPQIWTVIAHCTPVTEREYINDIYIFTGDEELAMVILGVNFTRVAIASLAKLLATSNARSSPATHPLTASAIDVTKAVPVVCSPSGSSSVSSSSSVIHSGMSTPPTELATPVNGFDDKASAMVTEKNLARIVSEQLETSEPLTATTGLQDLGLDSLLSVELKAEIESSFGISLPSDAIHNSITFGELLIIVQPLVKPTPVQVDLGSVAQAPALASTFAPILASTQVPADSSSNVEAKLARVIAEQLETTAALKPSTSLEDLGLDSLLSVELKGAIEEELGITLASDTIHSSITFGELLAAVSANAGSNAAPVASAVPPTLQDVAVNAKCRPGDNMQTLLFQTASDGTPLYADVYLPSSSQVSSSSRPVALMVHGGGFSMLSRRDIRPKQTALLLANGFLPISVDYRLCPEVSVLESIKDVCAALAWSRQTLPTLDLGVPGLAIDGTKVVVIGWSTGGTLALQLGYAAANAGIQPPNATLAFYCPSNFEDPFWKQPNFPENTTDKTLADYDLLEGVHEKPITSYNVDPKKAAIGGWMAPSDPRSRIVLHMNWSGQMIPAIFNGFPSLSNAKARGLSSSDFANMPQPSTDDVAKISPYTQIVRGNYKVPTYIIHGTKDDLIPWQQPVKVHEALKAQGVQTGLTIVDGAEHLFDLYRSRGKEWQVVLKGYEFLFKQCRS
ncbi:ketoacyl-synt-domain-containing protein [Periconia macrospinosa]|uniref:Ketoacyl-synt-domain-containing protein n=1 Tax=Periconia macrospinosa TaxID=97972 RepID=A0A2V1DGY1_9PLEO|nr:ketoacyl-synt-domain-containing protein [Periconia macrospinosa]